MRMFINGAIGAIALVCSAATVGIADTKAEEVLKGVRAAVGADTKLKSVSARGTYRRMIGDNEVSGDIELDALFPDQFIRRDIMDAPGGPGPTLITALNGDEAWRDVINPPGAGGMIVIRRAPGGDAPGAALTGVRTEFTRTLLGLLLRSPAGVTLEYSYAGVAEAEDGRAEMLDIKGPDNFAARLFIDQRTHLPLMLSYRAPEPRAQMRTSTGPHSANREEIAKRLEAERQQAEREAPPAPALVDTEMRFSDHRKVADVVLPHRVSVSATGKVIEEWEFTSFKLNTPLKPEQFTKSKS